METQSEKDLTLTDLIQVYRRRKNVVYGILLTLLVLTAVYCAVCTRRYEAQATVQLQKEGADAMGLEDLMSSATGGGSSPLDASVELQTQVNILQSDTLAIKTIEALNMENTYDLKPRWTPLGWLLGKISPGGPPDAPSAKFEDSPQRRQRALKVFSKNLQVKAITGTRLIEIYYTSPDPRLAAAVVNTITRNLADYTFQTRFDATNQASQWLSDQLGDLRKDSEALQAKVVELQRQSGVYSLGSSDAQGRDQAYSGVIDKLQQATLAMSAAEQNRILKGAIAKAAESGNAEMLSGLGGNALGGNSQGMNNAMALIQTLRQQQATEQATLQEAEAKYGSAYPKLAELRGNIAGLEHSIQMEIGRIKNRAKSDYDIAVLAESTTRKNYEIAKQQADTLNNKAIEYAIVRQEADESRALYEDLLKRLKEAGVLEGLHSSNITVVDPGRTPARPKTPAVPLDMTLALFGGWLLGCFGAVVIEALDNKVNTVQELEEMLKYPPLGVLPEIKLLRNQERRKMELIALDDPQSTFTEAVRSIRTSLLLSKTDAPPKIILVTSSITGEGKSLFSVNLAVVLAQSGARTLLIDTDLRRGTLSARLRMPSGTGLSNLLTGQKIAPPIQQFPGFENLDVLISGPVPPNPTDLLASAAMRTWLDSLRSQYDFLVLDSAPVLPVSDSIALNILTDATIILVRAHVTERVQVRRSLQLLKREGQHNHYVGVVLNALSINDSSYYGYYGYKKYGYSYAENGNYEKS